jgi:hypothetical protein
MLNNNQQNQPTMASCPNCKIPCTGCAGARLTRASNGAAVCTKCLPGYEQMLRGGGGAVPGGSPQNPRPSITPAGPYTPHT